MPTQVDPDHLQLLRRRIGEAVEAERQVRRHPRRVNLEQGRERHRVAVGRAWHIRQGKQAEELSLADNSARVAGA